jgi:hypothetical protein
VRLQQDAGRALGSSIDRNGRTTSRVDSARKVRIGQLLIEKADHHFGAIPARIIEPAAHVRNIVRDELGTVLRDGGNDSIVQPLRFDDDVEGGFDEHGFDTPGFDLKVAVTEVEFLEGFRPRPAVVAAATMTT